MIPSKVSSPELYTDLNGLAKLRTEAKSQSPDAIKETAKQFESLFVQMALKNMRNASPRDGLMDNDKTRFARDLYDQQLSVELGRKGALGLGDQIAKQLTKTTTAAAPLSGKSLADYRTQAFPRTYEQMGLVAPSDDGVEGGDERAAQRSAVPPSATFDLPDTPTKAFHSRSEFLEALWPHAKAAGDDLGVDPKLLLAQAALESGWGKALVQHADGGTSHNLFGIKADKSWQGERAAAHTLEFEGGIPVRRRAAFRSYDSYAESFKDYVAFLKSNPRYAAALNHADDPRQFARSLQKAGYATDPNYANKVMAVYRLTARSVDSAPNA